MRDPHDPPSLFMLAIYALAGLLAAIFIVAAVVGLALLVVG